MKVVILAGGMGTRLAEETESRPKPMVEIGGRPIIWHIMKHYAGYGLREFVITLGYKGELIKHYFLEYHQLSGDITLDVATGGVVVKHAQVDDWRVELIDTGIDTQTGGRIKRLESLLGNETFMLTFGDGVGNIEIDKLLAFHRAQGKLGTVTAVRPPARFGGIVFEDDLVAEFSEKPQIGEGWINGGFMVLDPGIFGYLSGDNDVLEVDLLERLARDRELSAYRHDAFWQCMDTLRDKHLLKGLWEGGSAPWKTWD